MELTVAADAQPVPADKVRLIEAAFAARIATILPHVDPVKINPGAKFLTEQAAYFAGAMTAFVAQGYQMVPLWTIAIMSSRNILHERSKPLAA